MPELTPELIFIGIVINRLVELAKDALPIGEDEKLEAWRAFIILGISFALGAIAVAAFFPAANIFPSAKTPLAGEIATGVFVGAIANGVDFTAGLFDSVGRAVNRLAEPKSA